VESSTYIGGVRDRLFLPERESRPVAEAWSRGRAPAGVSARKRADDATFIIITLGYGDYADDGSRRCLDIYCDEKNAKYGHFV
jgi:hypothetical protein